MSDAGDQPEAAPASRMPQRSVLADETYAVIKSMILEHRIAPGARVGIDGLARDLQVSQTPVREALARLESDKLVTKLPLRGYETTRLLTIFQFDDMFRFRALIEPWSAGRAASLGDPRLLEALVSELETIESIGDATSYAPYIEHDTRFHSLIAKYSGSPSAEEAFVHMHCHLHLFRLYNASQQLDATDRDGAFVRDLFAKYYAGPVLALSEHRAIADGIIRKDAAGAEKAMLAHVEASRARFAPAVEVINAR